MSTGIYATNSAEACEYVLSDCQANVIVVVLSITVLCLQESMPPTQYVLSDCQANVIDVVLSITALCLQESMPPTQQKPASTFSQTVRPML